MREKCLYPVRPTLSRLRPHLQRVACGSLLWLPCLALPLLLSTSTYLLPRSPTRQAEEGALYAVLPSPGILGYRKRSWLAGLAWQWQKTWWAANKFSPAHPDQAQPGSTVILNSDFRTQTRQDVEIQKSCHPPPRSRLVLLAPISLAPGSCEPGALSGLACSCSYDTCSLYKVPLLAA